MQGHYHLLESFLPIGLLARLHGTAGIRPAVIKFPAAVIFVDVSRYTALVEQLARRGQEGLEQIPRLLGLSYTRCAECVSKHGGEVLCFAGDSLLAYWPADREKLGSAVRIAVNCAEMICRTGHRKGAGIPNELSPALHVGVGAGQLCAAALGGQPVWTLLAMGEAIVEAAAAQGIARGGTYEISPAAALIAAGESEPESLLRWASVGDYLQSPPLDWLTGFLPMQVRETLLAPVQSQSITSGSLAVDLDSDRHVDARLAELTEIRPVSALFARIVGLDLNDSDALLQHHELCASLQEIVRAHGGPPGDLFCGDKGLIFSTTFGARGNFNRDDPRRAVDAARAINHAIDLRGLSSSIGVATGDALFGVVGSSRRRQLMVHGSSMNRAARLMTAAETGILCDAPTERSTRTAFKFEERGALQLVGLGDMAAVFRPAEHHELPTSSPVLIGRERELESLRRTFDDARLGETRLLAVIGESGIGKSALVTAFSDELRSMATTVALARAERDDRRTSLLPWRRVLASLLGLSPDSEGTFILRAITSRVAMHPTIMDRLALLNGVLGVELPENESTRHLEGAHRGDATMRLLGDLLAIIAPRPVVLVLEDSQWLDSASWRLLEWIIATHSSILILACVRLEEIPEELRNLQRRAEAARMTASEVDLEDPARSFRIMEVEELSDHSTRELVARTVASSPPEPALADRISALACGNPLFAEEIALSLKTEGLIAIRDGCWRSIRPLNELKYFEGVERVIRERIDRVDPNLLDVLKASAVIGRSFTVRLLQQLLELSSHHLTAILDSLVAMHFLRRGPTEDAYEFRHDQIRDVVYGSIAGDRRHQLHGILAQWLERSEASTTGAEFAVLAQHFEAAGNKEKAVEYAEMAASKALQVGAFREVEDFLRICFSHEVRQRRLSAEERLRAVHRRIQLAEAHYSRGDIHAVGGAIRRALTMAGESNPSSPANVVVRLAGSALHLLFQQILSPSRRYNSSQKAWECEIARCHNHAAAVEFFELRFLPTILHLIQAVVHAERAGVSPELAVACSQMASGFGNMGQMRAAEHFVRKAERVAIELADPAIYSHVCFLDAMWRVGRGDWSVVDGRTKQSQELSLLAGDQLRWGSAQVIRFWSQFYRGDWGALEQTAQSLLSRAQSCGNAQQEIWALRCKALCALHADRPREAVEVFKLITSAMRGSADLAAQVSSKGSLALAHARVGQNDESLEAVDETLRLLRQMRRPTSHSTLVGLSGLCEVLLRGREASLSREYDQWNDWESGSLQELKRYSQVFPIGRPRYGLWAGVTLWLDGRKDRAFRVWNRALSDSQRLSLRHDEAMIAAEIRRRRDRL
ncbi:AAA family ATPase [Bradyrhizobium sp. CCGUVB14]|uniref:AAA family ATPase n=1 Tax=Bradyrhizobium sp. CCGUVB14 TaxID=2949628 RepID=UPI0020B1AC47|nr:adenylate/guanylate cyclase domain-containing protein [Bradyrhizobium sp. CCGUVB14]MCP3446153.1 AAA family ATPase [Bradyrhizobium sp. CCGUVB14]